MQNPIQKVEAVEVAEVLPSAPIIAQTGGGRAFGGVTIAFTNFCDFDDYLGC